LAFAFAIFSSFFSAFSAAFWASRSADVALAGLAALSGPAAFPAGAVG